MTLRVGYAPVHAVGARSLVECDQCGAPYFTTERPEQGEFLEIPCTTEGCNGLYGTWDGSHLKFRLEVRG